MQRAKPPVLTAVGDTSAECVIFSLCHLSASSSEQMEQPKNDTDVDQDADLAYNTLKVRLDRPADRTQLRAAE